jgi:penicillin V acylase-like amidase (Ntn superfamily)
MSRAALLISLLVAALLVSGGLEADTAFVIKRGETVLLGRNSDAPSPRGYVFVNRRGVSKESFGAASGRPLRLTSECGSVTFNRFGREFPEGGINEAGLCLEALPGPAAYPTADGRPVLCELQWVQYQLDRRRSVKDVLRSLSGVRVSRLVLNRHFLAADAGGNAAVIEFIDGRPVAYRGRDLPAAVLTDAPYGESAARLRQVEGFRPEEASSGASRATVNFLSASSLLGDFDWTLGGVLSDYFFTALRSLAEPNTQWSIVYNIPRRLVFFKTRTHRRLKLVSLKAFDFSCRNPALMIAADTAEGWVLTGSFIAFDPRANRLLLERAADELGSDAEGSRILPPDVVRRMSEYPAACRCR